MAVRVSPRATALRNTIRSSKTPDRTFGRPGGEQRRGTARPIATLCSSWEDPGASHVPAALQDDRLVPGQLGALRDCQGQLWLGCSPHSPMGSAHGEPRGSRRFLLSSAGSL